MKKTFQKEELHKVYFTSDLHFGHPNIINYCKRPFSSAEEMDSVLIEYWNRIVSKGDHIFILGDFSFHTNNNTQRIIRRLNGIKYLILGNHDAGLRGNVKTLFTGGVDNYGEITCGFDKLILCHFPFRSWNYREHGSWNLHGHTHGTLAPEGLQLDVGVDCHNYCPISYFQVKAIMDKIALTKN